MPLQRKSVGISLVAALAAIISLVVLFGPVFQIPFTLPENAPTETPTQSNNYTRSEGSLVLPLYDKTWKISNTQGLVDWSPVEDIFVVGKTVYGADGKALYDIASLSENQTMADARFSPDGSKIAYLYRYLDSQHDQFVSPLQIFDTKNRTIVSVQITVEVPSWEAFSWGADNNTIFYLNGGKIIRHDLNTGEESVIAQSGSRSIRQFDISHNGTNIAFIDALVDRSCNYGGCVTDRLIVAPLPSISGNETAIISSSDESAMTNSSTRLPFKVISEFLMGDCVSNPRWAPDDSVITYSIGPCFTLKMVPCPIIGEISRDGNSNRTIFPSGYDRANQPCYPFNAVFNKDLTMVAYSIYVLNNEFFEPEKAGTYLSLAG